jgi:hypothetical protein
MAKLRAHGAEVFRLTKAFVIDPTDTDRLTTEERKTVSIRSDLACLTKLQVKFKPDRLDPDGRWHDYGWKLKLRGSQARAIAVHGKHVTVREIAQHRNETGFMSGNCQPRPGVFIGPPTRHLVQHGNSIKVRDWGSYAYPCKATDSSSWSSYA